MSLTVKSQTHNVPFKRLLTYYLGTEWVLSKVNPLLEPLHPLFCSLLQGPSAQLN